jgi:uncharacterized protein YcfJ
MRKILLTALACCSVAACSSPQQTAGTAIGATAGAVVAGPIGLVAGGAIGALTTAPGGSLSAGYCYRTNRRGQVLHDRYGRALTRRC